MNDKQPEKYRTIMAIIRDLVFEVTERGYSQQAFCKTIGISPDELKQENAWVGLETGHRAWQAALDVTQDVFLGLKMGQKNNVSVAGTVAYLMQSCPDLLTAFGKVCQYNEAYTNVFSYSITKQNNAEVVIDYQPVDDWIQNYPHTAQQAIETSMTRTCAMLRLLSGKTIVPLRAYFACSLTKDKAMYEKLLCASLYFDQAQSQLVFSLNDFQQPVLTANKLLLPHFEQLIQQQLPAYPKVDYWIQKVRQIMTKQPMNKQLSLGEVSEMLHITPRSLQRKLKEENESFQAIANDVQQQRAINLLQQTQLNISEIAFMLGYAEPSVFRRAFKRWTGKTPKEYIDKS